MTTILKYYHVQRQRLGLYLAVLPQVTSLALSLGTIFTGAVLVEVIFSYPGLGYTIYRAIVSADYNLIMGITILSIIGIATISLIIDLTYPLFDPRIKLK